MAYRVVSISGEVASGKSSITDQLTSLLPGWERFNTGQRFREFCVSQGMTIQQVSFVPDNIHKDFDDYQTELMRSGEKIIVEGRLAGWLSRDMHHVFRVFCTAPLHIRVSRYMERQEVTEEQAIKDIEYRDTRDIKKFTNMYGVDDYRASQFYSSIFDTSSHTPHELAIRIIKKANLHANAMTVVKRMNK